MSTRKQKVGVDAAAEILGIPYPLVIHRIEIGDLPFRHVGKHRYVKLEDVLHLKARIDAQRNAMKALVTDAEDLYLRYNI